MLVWLVLIWIQGVVIVKVIVEGIRGDPFNGWAIYGLNFAMTPIRLFLTGFAILALGATRWKLAPWFAAAAILYNHPIAPNLENWVVSRFGIYPQPFVLNWRIALSVSALLSFAAAGYLVLSPRVRGIYAERGFSIRPKAAA